MLKTTHAYFKKYLDFLNQKDLYPSVYTVDGPSAAPEVIVKGKTYLNFSSNNYLGLAGNEQVKQAVVDGVKRYGVGSGSTRMLSGTLDIQVEFEKKLAKWLGCDDAITFSSGFLANVGVIRMLVDPFPYFSLSLIDKKGVIFSDELNHASIIDGVRLAKAERVVYKHSDMAELERVLKKYKNKKKLILTDGVFSMDGDVANLKEIGELSRKYDALVMVDDAHGVGILGPHGSGTSHQLGVAKDMDVVMGSFTKAFGNLGGFIAADQVTIDYLRITARSYIFSDPIPPALVAGLLKTLEIIENDDELRSTVLDNAEYFREQLKKLGFTVLGQGTSIVPLLIGSEEKAIAFSRQLFENGVLAPCIRRPAVEPGKERIRFSLMASHTRIHIDRLLTICEKLGRETRII